MVAVNGELNRIEKKKKTFLESKGRCILEIAEAATASAEMKIQAELEAEAAEIKAEGDMMLMIDEAGCIKADARTESLGHTLLTKRRKHDLDLREKQILGDLAEKGTFNLIGTSGDKMVAAMLKGQFDKT